MPNYKFAAVDTYFLLEITKGNPDYQGIFDALRGLGFFLVVTDTVMQELQDLRTRAANPEIGKHAEATIRELGSMDVLTPTLEPVQRGVAEIIANKLAALLPNGQKNDGLVLAEAAVHNCRILVSNRAAISQGDSQAIRLALVLSDVENVVPLNPDNILDLLKQVTETLQWLKSGATKT